MSRTNSNDYPRSWWLCMWAALACALWLAVCPPAEAASPATACHEPAVQPLPFEPVLDTRLTHAQLTTLAGGDPLAGAVFARRHVALSADGCTLSVGWAQPVIYIAAELLGNRCAFEHVLAHEMEHVRIYRAALVALPQRIGALRAQGLASVAAAEQALIEVRALHAAHDNPDELGTNRTACRRRIPVLLAGG